MTPTYSRTNERTVNRANLNQMTTAKPTLIDYLFLSIQKVDLIKLPAGH